MQPNSIAVPRSRARGAPTRTDQPRQTRRTGGSSRCPREDAEALVQSAGLDEEDLHSVVLPEQ